MYQSRATGPAAILLVAALAACSAATSASHTPGTATPSASAAPSSAAPSPSVAAADSLVAIDDGRSLWLECAGTGDPTIILESGLGGDHRTWERVQPALAESARVCTYDRAGIGESESAPAPRTAATAVDDLHALLEAAEISPPYVVVGFSFGGAITQLFAQTYPDEIAGLVLVESNHPLEAEQFESNLTPEQVDEDRAGALDNPEGMDVFTSLDELKAAGRLPDVPLVVVTAGISEGWPPGWDAETFDALRAAQQADLATFTPQGRQVVAESSAHQVPAQQPTVIVEAVESVLAELGG